MRKKEYDTLGLFSNLTVMSSFLFFCMHDSNNYYHKQNHLPSFWTINIPSNIHHNEKNKVDVLLITFFSK